MQAAPAVAAVAVVEVLLFVAARLRCRVVVVDGEDDVDDDDDVLDKTPRQPLDRVVDDEVVQQPPRLASKFVAYNMIDISLLATPLMVLLRMM
jgi:hypothetical protein